MRESRKTNERKIRKFEKNKKKKKKKKDHEHLQKIFSVIHRQENIFPSKKKNYLFQKNLTDRKEVKKMKKQRKRKITSFCFRGIFERLKRIH